MTAETEIVIPDVDLSGVSSVGFTAVRGVGPREIPLLETLFEVISEMSCHLGKFVWADDGRGIRWPVATWHDQVTGELTREAYLETHWRHGELLADEVCPDRHFVDVGRDILNKLGAVSQCCRRHGVRVRVCVTG